MSRIQRPGLPQPSLLKIGLYFHPYPLYRHSMAMAPACSRPSGHFLNSPQNFTRFCAPRDQWQIEFVALGVFQTH